MVLIIDTTRDAYRLVALRRQKNCSRFVSFLEEYFSIQFRKKAFTQKLQYHSDTPSTLDRTTSSSVVLLEAGYSVSDAPRPRSYPKNALD